jgi:hypothetical protein
MVHASSLELSFSVAIGKEISVAIGKEIPSPKKITMKGISVNNMRNLKRFLVKQLNNYH